MTFLCSVQHSPDVEVSDFRHVIESMMVLAACEYGLNTDFEKLVNPTGRFVIGGPFADCGVTGRKLACDTYGGIGHIGGGAMSGKDPSKVDRSGAYMARKIARDIVLAGYAERSARFRLLTPSVWRSRSACMSRPSARSIRTSVSSNSMSEIPTTLLRRASSTAWDFSMWTTTA